MHAPGPVTAVLDDTPMSDMIEDHAEWLEQALSTSNDMHTQRPVENSPGTGDFDEFSFLMNTNFGFVDQYVEKPISHRIAVTNMLMLADRFLLMSSLDPHHSSAFPSTSVNAS